MNINREIMKDLKDSFTKNNEFEFIAGLEELTLADMDCIEKISKRNSRQYKINYQIIDNTYIKIHCIC